MMLAVSFCPVKLMPAAEGISHIKEDMCKVLTSCYKGKGEIFIIFHGETA